MSSHDLEARLAAARAAKEAADAKRAALAEKRAPLETVEQLELEAADATAIASAEEEHGPIGQAIGTCSTFSGVVIVKRPAAVFWRHISRDMNTKSEAKLEDAANRLLAHCLVHPSREAYEQLVEKYPALPGRLVALIGRLASGGADAGE